MLVLLRFLSKVFWSTQSSSSADESSSVFVPASPVEAATSALLGNDAGGAVIKEIFKLWCPLLSKCVLALEYRIQISMRIKKCFWIFFDAYHIFFLTTLNWKKTTKYMTFSFNHHRGLLLSLPIGMCIWQLRVSIFFKISLVQGRILVLQCGGKISIESVLTYYWFFVDFSLVGPICFLIKRGPLNLALIILPDDFAYAAVAVSQRGLRSIHKLRW